MGVGAGRPHPGSSARAHHRATPTCAWLSLARFWSEPATELLARFLRLTSSTSRGPLSCRVGPQHSPRCTQQIASAWCQAWPCRADHIARRTLREGLGPRAAMLAVVAAMWGSSCRVQASFRGARARTVGERLWSHEANILALWVGQQHRRGVT